VHSHPRQPDKTRSATMQFETSNRHRNRRNQNAIVGGDRCHQRRGNLLVDRQVPEVDLQRSGRPSTAHRSHRMRLPPVWPAIRIRCAGCRLRRTGARPTDMTLVAWEAGIDNQRLDGGWPRRRGSHETESPRRQPCNSMTINAYSTERTILESWRRREDSNLRYQFSQYNDLANRRLKPLGHVSA